MERVRPFSAGITMRPSEPEQPPKRFGARGAHPTVESARRQMIFRAAAIASRRRCQTRSESSFPALQVRSPVELEVGGGSRVLAQQLQQISVLIEGLDALKHFFDAANRRNHGVDCRAKNSLAAQAQIFDC